MIPKDSSTGPIQRLLAMLEVQSPMNENTRFHPVIGLLSHSRWDTALIWLRAQSRAAGYVELVETLPPGDDRADMRIAVVRLVDALYAKRDEVAARHALAWQMMLVDPKHPATFWPVMPRLQALVNDVNVTSLDTTAIMRTWWKATAGRCRNEWQSIFALVDRALVRAQDLDLDLDDPAIDGPHVVVMPTEKSPAKTLPVHEPFKSLRGARVPLVVAKDVALVRRTLLAEYPHAVTAVDLLLRDLREGEPVRLKPMLLVGPPGNGKSRLIRRLGDLLGIGVYRFDGGSSADGVGFGGTPRGWGETTPSVPARAVEQYRQANVMVMVDEIEKASANPRNGALWSVMLAHLERETAARFRDVSLDAELDCSWVNHLATANDVAPLPEPLKDRYRLIKVPAPGLAHLPRLAANVVSEIAREEQGFEAPLAQDELEVIGQAWERSGFSVRKLQKIVAATLEARSACARRH